MGEPDENSVLAVPLWEVVVYDRDYDDRRGRWEKEYLVADKGLADRLVAANNAQLLAKYNEKLTRGRRATQQEIAEHNALVAAGLRTDYEDQLPDYEDVVQPGCSLITVYCNRL